MSDPVVFTQRWSEGTRVRCNPPGLSFEGRIVGRVLQLNQPMWIVQMDLTTLDESFREQYPYSTILIPQNCIKSF